jgi:hypothetical protein
MQKYKRMCWHAAIYTVLLSLGAYNSRPWSGADPAPYSGCINENVERVREKKRWIKEVKWRERGRRRDQSPSILFCIRHWPWCF